MLGPKHLLFFAIAASSLSPYAYAQSVCSAVFNEALTTPTTIGKKEKIDKNLELKNTSDVVDAKPAPKDPQEIERLAEKTWASGKVKDKVSHLQKVHSWMNYRFPGREAEISRVMATLKVSILFPDNVKKPPVIDMFGFPGDGKTDMISTLGQYLGLKSRFVQVAVKDGQVAIGLEVFRALSDTALDGTQAPVSFLVIDEFQKLKKDSDLSTSAKQITGDFVVAKDSGNSVDEVQQRKGFVRLLYDIFGNAKEKAAPTKKMDVYAQEISPYSIYVRDNRIEMARLLDLISSNEKSMEEAADAAAKAAFLANINASKQSVANLTKTNKTYETQLRKSIRALKKDYAEVLGPFRELSLEELLEKMVAAPEAFNDLLREMAEGSDQFQKVYTYKQMITFLLGNPEQTIKDVRQKNKGMTLDADQYVESVRQVDPAKVRTELFDDIFGTDAAGLRQRLNVDQWNLMTPLSKEKWLHFVSRQVEVMQTQFVSLMDKANLKGMSLKLDPSVRDLLYSEAVIPTEGARVYFERATMLTGNFISDLATRMVEAPKASRPQEILWAFDPLTREFIVRGLKKGATVFEERASVVSISNKQNKKTIDSYDRIRMLTQKAGQIVMGLSTYRSLPKSFRVDFENMDSSVTGLWNAPKKGRITTTSDYINLALGANVAQNFLRDGFVSMSDPSLQFSHEMVRRLVEDLKLREQEYHFLVEKLPDGKKKYLESFPEPLGLSKDVLEALKEAASVAPTEKKEEIADLEAEAYGKVLRLMIRDINSTLQENAELLRGIARLLDYRTSQFEAGHIQSPDITTADILNLVKGNKIYEKKGPLLNRILVAAHLKKDKEDHGPLITLKSLKKLPGQIDTRDTALLVDNPRVVKANIFERMFRALFNRPFKQRSLTPN